jgi:hypothetical protein
MFSPNVDAVGMLPARDELADQPLPELKHDGDYCIDFENLTPGTNYVVGDSFIADNTGLQAKITGEPFTWSDGRVTSRGFAQVDPGSLAGASGQDIQTNNILLNFDFGGAVPGATINFGEYGGNLNLEINGDFRNFNNFQDVNGAVIGGTSVTVPAGGLGNDTGLLRVDGPINSIKVGGQELWIDHVCVPKPQQEGWDWGDAPDKPYPTLEASGGAVHGIRREVHLGRRVDAEADGQPSLNADGDDANPAPADDEDGVTFLTPLIPGSPAKVEVIASVDGYLNAWIDFGRDGVWSPATSDEIFAGQLLVAGINVLTFNVPLDAKVDPQRPAYSRWRFSTTDKLLAPEKGSPTGSVPDGEVEDHLAFIRENPEARFDFGDAPDKPYPTLEASGGAVHGIRREVHLGRRVDAEADGQPSLNADGDDANPAPADDEDGVTFLTPLIPGSPAKVEVIASVDGYLNAWI